jgi:hypothetical protein
MSRIRVKRPRSDQPIDVLVIDPSKRPRSIDSILDALHLSGSRQIFRRVNSSCPSAYGLTPEAIEERKAKKSESWHKASMEKRQQHSMKVRQTLVLQATSSVILCDGVPLTRYRLQDNLSSADCDLVDEEYERVEASDAEIMWLAQGVVEMHSADCSDEGSDSENSNREAHPWNEYPDEDESLDKASNDTDEGCSSEREDYEDYVVESDSDW